MDLVTEIREFIETTFRAFLGFWSPLFRRPGKSFIKKQFIALVELALSLFEEKVIYRPALYKVTLKLSPYYLSFQDYTQTNTNLVRAPNA